MEIATGQLPFNFNVHLNGFFADCFWLNQMEETVKKFLIGCLRRQMLMMLKYTQCCVNDNAPTTIA